MFSFYFCWDNPATDMLAATEPTELSLPAYETRLWVWAEERVAHSNNQLPSYLLVEVSAGLQLPEKKVSKAATCG